METLTIPFQPFFDWLVRTTLQAGLLVCLILLLQAVLRNRLSIRWHYSLWLLLVVRMVLPWAPQSRVSPFNVIPQSMTHRQADHAPIPTRAESVASGPDITGTSKSTPATPSGTIGDSKETATTTSPKNKETKSPARRGSFEFASALPVVWLTAALALAVYVFASNFNLLKIVKRQRQLTDQRILDLLEDCKSQMGIRTVLGVVTTDKIKSPALFGFVRPRLLLPSGMIETLNQEELRYVFLHELAHLKRHDIYVGWLMSILQILHWFNPLVWLAFRRMRADRELACDALVLARAYSDEPKSYGRIILNLLERFSRPQPLPGIAGIIETKSQLKRRIAMIAKFKKNSYQWSPLGVILVIILACIFLPDAINTKASQALAPESAPLVSLHRVWADSDVDIEGAISPDGRYISYTDWDTGDLAVYEVATGKKRRLTNKGTWDESDEFAEFSRWSPDSKQIVYDWYNNHFIELRIVGLDGSEPRILYRNEEVGWAQTYDWSPDGKQILACFTTKGRDQIVLVSIADGSVRVLKTLGNYYPQNMVLSPDGRYIVYDFPQKESSPESNIFLLLADGSREFALVEHPADDRILDWTPDGKNILFTSDRTGSPCVWSIAVADGMVQGIPKLVRQDVAQKFISLGFTNEGSFYFGCGGTGISDVYTTRLDPKTGKVLIPPKKAIQRFEGHNRTPDYSPDGKYMAYVTNRGRQQVLCIHSLETGHEREFPSKLRRILDPRWSPDGNSILIAGLDYNINRYGHYQIDPKAGAFTPVLLPSKDFRFGFHEWSRDGKSFFLSRTSIKDEQSQIVLREIESGKEKEIYHSSRSKRLCLACSPDGKWLAFIDMRNDGALRIIPSGGGEPRELYKCEPKKEQLIALRWTADGKYILFVIKEIDQNKLNLLREIEQERLHLWRIPVEGGEPQKIDLGINTISLSVHPDGQHIALGTWENQPAEVWVMENFLPTTSAAKPEPELAPMLRRVEVRGRGSVHSQPSFDGKYMSDVERKTGRLIIRELATGKERILPTNSDPNWFVYESRISPDNKKVVFLQFNPEVKDYDLRVIGLDGSGLRTLLQSAQIGGYFDMDAWSPDARYILGRLERKPTQLVRLCAEDGVLEVIKTFEQDTVSKVAVSPDGRYIAYSRTEQTSKPDIFVFDLERREESPVVTSPSADKLLGWTPDGQSIFFASDRNETWDGWLVRVEDGKPRGLPEIIKAGIGDVSPMGFTQTGAFYYGFGHEAWNIYTVALDLGANKVLSEPGPVRDVGKDGCPDWSPDGQYLAYCSQPDSDKPQIIRIRTLATGEDRELKPDLPHFDWIRWCPDGRHLLITSFKWGDPSVVYRLDAQTGKHTMLVQSDKQRIRGAELSADGKTLAYRIRGSGNSNWLYVRDLETGREKEVLQSGATAPITLSPFNAGWALSPDGKHIALSVREGETDKPLKPLVLKIISIASGEARTIAEPPISEMAWTSDGHELLFVRHGNELWRVSAESGEPQKLWEWERKQALWGPRIHPDARRLAFYSGGYVSEMWVIENFLPATAVAKPEPMTTVRTIGGDWGTFASLSPDGRFMCDVDWDTENLAVLELATGKVRHLTSKSSGDACYPLDSAISPDGKDVAYLWFDPNTKASSLHVVGLDGSGDRILCEGKYPMPRAWSADGKRILAVISENKVQQMVWVSTSDGSIQRIASFPGESLGYPGKFDISPDGRFIAYDRPGSEDSSKRDLVMFDLNRNVETSVVAHPADDRLLGWTPDAKHVLFASDRAGSWDAWLLQVADGKPQGFPKLVKNSIGEVRPIGFTPYGSYYYAQERILEDVFTAKLDLDTGEVLSEPVPVRQTGTTSCHDWSPDGAYLAYCERRPDESQVIHVRTLATGQERTLADHLPYIRWLRWSLDGGSILIDGAKSGDSQGVIYKIDVRTGERIDLVRSETEVLIRPEMSPDGKTLFFDRSDPKSKTSRLVARDLKTGHERELIRIDLPARLTGSALSSDGQQLVLSIAPSRTGVDGPVLKIMPATGGEAKELIRFAGSERLWALGGTWMPDSRNVLFWKWFLGDRSNELWRISVDGGEPLRLWVPKDRNIGPGHLRVHPNGQRIAFYDRSTTRGVWVMENFLPQYVGK